MLLDQNIVAGIGNIYSDEILFTAGIRPDKPCDALTDGDFERLASAIPERLNFFIEKNAISFEEYAPSKGRDYRNTPYLQVYGKGGQALPRMRSDVAAHCSRRQKFGFLPALSEMIFVRP